MNIDIRIAKVGNAWIAGTRLAGMTIRGKRADSEDQAVRALLWRFADPADDDAAMAIELAVNGSTIDNAFGELDAGD